MTESQPAGRAAAIRPMRPVVFVLIVFVSVFAVVGVSKWWMPKELVPWQSDLGAAVEQSHKTHKPLLLYFTATWCAPCQEMRRHVWTDGRVAAAAAAFVPVKVDVDQNPQLALKFGANESIPILVVLRTDGSVERRIDYALDADDMIAWLSGQGIAATLP